MYYFTEHHLQTFSTVYFSTVPNLLLLVYHSQMNAKVPSLVVHYIALLFSSLPRSFNIFNTKAYTHQNSIHTLKGLHFYDKYRNPFYHS